MIRPSDAEPTSAPTTVVALIVTWNRREHVQSVLAALSRQGALSRGLASLHVVVIDNAGTDGTAESLASSWSPDRVVANNTDRAHEPDFRPSSPELKGAAEPAHPGRPAFASLTLVRNSHNLGGCGGFNTGFAYTEREFTRASGRTPEFVWLVDDDADLPDDALAHMLSAMRSDPSIGLVGSRTVNIADRATTIETTIYFDRTLGRMCPEPPAAHPFERQYRDWLASPGGGGGQRVGPGRYSGLLDVDVVSACSLLARWSDVVGTPDRPGIGFWDKRYFIYCDDADWCLRFRRAGRRVVLCLDAVVYHTPWLLKLTPQRLYYAQRNASWMTRKLYEGDELRRVTRLWMRNLMRDAIAALTHRRLTHASVIMQTVEDIIDERWGIDGKTAPSPPPPATTEQVRACLDHASRTGRPLALVIHSRAALDLAAGWLHDQFRGAPTGSTATAGSSPPPLLLVVANAVPGFEHATPPTPDSLPEPLRAARILIHGARWRSKIKKQLALLAARPSAVVVFDNTCPLPILPACPTIHVDSRTPNAPFIETESWGTRLLLLARWLRLRRKAARYARSVRHDPGAPVRKAQPDLAPPHPRSPTPA